MVVVSQIWIQHLHCQLIIGHCYLRGGSELEPELGGALYTALAIAMTEIEKSPQYVMSGVYGYRIPEFEGIGLFTVQNDHFRIFFLCEGLYGYSLPYLAGKEISDKIIKLFDLLEKMIAQDTCAKTHKSEDGSFWFDLLYSIGFGGQIPIEELKRVYPLQDMRVKVNRLNNYEVNVVNLESTFLTLLGYGWADKEKMIASKIDGIFCKPKYSFLLYEALFHQMGEFIPDFEPNIIILTYQRGDLLENQSSLVAFLNLKADELYIRYCLPVTSGFFIEESQSIHSYLKSLILDPLQI